MPTNRVRRAKVDWKKAEKRRKRNNACREICCVCMLVAFVCLALTALLYGLITLMMDRGAPIRLYNWYGRNHVPEHVALHAVTNVSV